MPITLPPRPHAGTIKPAAPDQLKGEEMISGGILRSGVRLEIRISSPAMFVADTYTLIDGKEVHVQSYRFTKS